MAETPDEGFDPLPALTEPPSPDEELRLQDALTDAPPPVADVAPPVPLGRAAAYDFINRRLVPSVSGGPLMTRGIETLATWIEKCLRTRRGESPAVDPDFGLDLTHEDLLEEGTPFDASLVAEYVSAIERALTTHPRIVALSDTRITGDANDDAVYVSFRVEVDDEDLGEVTFDRLRLGS